MIQRGMESTATGLRLETRKAMLGTLVLLANENRELLDTIHGQVSSLQKISDTDPSPELPPENLSLKTFTATANPSDAPVDTISRDLLRIQNLRNTSNRLLGTEAYYSLKPIWNRMKIYSVTPRGRPLPQGIGYITSPFGMRVNPFNPGGRAADFHAGVDVASSPGTPIIATSSGRVIKVLNITTSGYGLYVKIHHGLGYTSLYSHNRANIAREGDFVEKGEVIAHMGQSGAATGYHVHYEVAYGLSNQIDPMEYIQIK